MYLIDYFPPIGHGDIPRVLEFIDEMRDTLKTESSEEDRQQIMQFIKEAELDVQRVQAQGSSVP
jgi:predicted nucleotidyltransferase